MYDRHHHDYHSFIPLGTVCAQQMFQQQLSSYSQRVLSLSLLGSDVLRAFLDDLALCWRSPKSVMHVISSHKNISVRYEKCVSAILQSDLLGSPPVFPQELGPPLGLQKPPTFHSRRTQHQAGNLTLKPMHLQFPAFAVVSALPH